MRNPCDPYQIQQFLYFVFGVVLLFPPPPPQYSVFASSYAPLVNVPNDVASEWNAYDMIMHMKFFR